MTIKLEFLPPFKEASCSTSQWIHVAQNNDFNYFELNPELPNRHNRGQLFALPKSLQKMISTVFLYTFVIMCTLQTTVYFI